MFEAITGLAARNSNTSHVIVKLICKLNKKEDVEFKYIPCYS